MIFKTLETTDIVTGRIQKISTPVWSNNEFELNSYFTSSIQIQPTGSTALEPLSGLYYWDVYDKNPDSEISSEIQFSISYGHKFGSGSLQDVNDNKIFPTKAIYNQYKNLLLAPNDTEFTFATSSLTFGTSSNDIYVISIAGNRYKEKFDAGQFQFALKGNNGTFYFIDDSSESKSNLKDNDKVFNIVSGTLENGVYKPSTSSSLFAGLFYPDLGTIVLHPRAIGEIVGSDLIPDTSANVTTLNQYKLYNSLSSVYGANSGSFIGRSTEFIPTKQFFIRVRNDEFNYSNNPSFVLSNQSDTSLNGTLRFPDFSTNPKVFVTTVGLYNENNDLVAVAKLSQPLEKTFESEVLIKIKLNF